MRLNSKYGIDDRVWYLRVSEVAAVEPCGTCDGTGYADLLKGGSVSCPECHGRRSISTGTRISEATIEPRTIGQVRIEARVSRPLEVTYMAHESGIGSGAVLSERDLFGSRREAEDAAAERGAVIRHGEGAA